MSRPSSEERDACNRCRYRPDDPGGHYESYFQRANHPKRNSTTEHRAAFEILTDRQDHGIVRA